MIIVHAYLNIRNDDFIENVKALSNHKSEKFQEYDYAFLVKTGSKTDTLYSDSTLKTWILKSNGENLYYYDEQGKIAEDLRSTYSFFRDCW